MLIASICASLPGITCECNDIQNAVQILCNKKHYELTNFKNLWREELITEDQQYWYTLGQCDGLIAAHEEVLRVMKWNEPHIN